MSGRLLLDTNIIIAIFAEERVASWSAWPTLSRCSQSQVSFGLG